VLTHLHIDHDGGLGGFPASEILVSPGELKRASGIAGSLLGYLPNRWPKSFDPKPLILDNGAYGPFPQSKRLTADGAIVAVATGGHTPDHFSVIVNDGDVSLFIAGDASYTETAMLAGQIDGVSPDEGAASSTLAAIRAFAASRPTIYLPAHDPHAERRLAERRVAPVVAPAVASASMAGTGAAGALKARVDSRKR
jgi:N-acyl homoserine lactone hydrolase